MVSGENIGGEWTSGWAAVFAGVFAGVAGDMGSANGNIAQVREYREKGIEVVASMRKIMKRRGTAMS